MFLSREIVERVLSQHGITEWHNLYLSSETGVRKDTGELYKYMLNKFMICGVHRKKYSSKPLSASFS